jgi:hypothetical protein
VDKKRNRAITMRGSHQKTGVFGALTYDVRQMFRQYDKSDQHAFLDYLKCFKEEFGEILLQIMHQSTITL